MFILSLRRRESIIVGVAPRTSRASLSSLDDSAHFCLLLAAGGSARSGRQGAGFVRARTCSETGEDDTRYALRPSPIPLGRLPVLMKLYERCV